MFHEVEIRVLLEPLLQNQNAEDGLQAQLYIRWRTYKKWRTAFKLLLECKAKIRVAKEFAILSLKIRAFRALDYYQTKQLRECYLLRSVINAKYKICTRRVFAEMDRLSEIPKTERE
jgi:hypothetical protein